MYTCHRREQTGQLSVFEVDYSHAGHKPHGRHVIAIHVMHSHAREVYLVTSNSIHTLIHEQPAL